MPRKYTKRTTRRTNKRYKKRYAKKNTKVSPTRSLGLGFPKKLLITHKYVESQSLTTTTGAIASYIWSTNSLYDPNASGVGHQPMFYDQLGAIYNHYTVIGSRVRFRFVPSGNNVVPYRIVTYINDDTGITPGTIAAMAEQNSARVTIVPMAPSNANTLILRWSAKKAMGRSVLANDALGAAVGANPAEQQYFTFALQPMDGSSTIVGYLMAEIEYIALWKELKDIETS